NNLDKLHKFAARGILKNASPRLLTELWIKTLQIENFSMRNTIRNRLQPYIHKCVGQSFTSTFCAKIRYTGCNLGIFARRCRKVVWGVDIGTSTRVHLSRFTRVIPLKGRDLRSFLVNSSRSNFECLGPPFCCKENHLSTPLSQFGPLGQKVENVGLSYVPNL